MCRLQVLLCGLLLLVTTTAAGTEVTVSYAYPLIYEWTPPADTALEGAIGTTFAGDTTLSLLEPDSSLFRLNTTTWRYYFRWNATEPKIVAFLGGDGDTVTVTAWPEPVTPYAPGRHDVPTFHLQTAPANLWDPATGIYCWGDSTNFEQRGEEWERPATLTIRDADGGVILAGEPVGLRIHGETSRQFAQKGLRIYFDDYGSSDDVLLDLFGGSREPFSRLVLRTARYPEFCLRDNLANTAFLDLGHLGSRYRFVALYLNDEYWGGYNLRERLDSRWAETTLGLPAGGYALVKDGQTIAGNGGDWDGLLWWASRPADYTDPAWYQQLAGRLDLDSYTDWLIVNILLATADNGYINNVAQLRIGDGPWRIVMWDEDDVMLPENVGADLFRFFSAASADQFAAWRPPVWYMGGWTERVQLWCDLFRHALQNPAFRDGFSARWDELTAGPLSLSALLDRLDVLVREQAREIPAHGERWGWNATAYADRVAEIEQFLADRLPLARAQKSDFFATFHESVALSDLQAVRDGRRVRVTWRTEHEEGLDGFVLMRAEGTPEGFVEIASYRELPELRGHNTDQPVDYVYDDESLPAGGTLFYRLRHETLDGERILHVWYATVELTPPPPLVVNELLASNDTVLADEFGEFDDWVELYNAGSDTVSLDGLYLSDDPLQPLRWPLPDLAIPPSGYLLVWCDDDPEQGLLHAPFKLSASGEAVVVTASDGRTVDQVVFGPQTTDVSYGRVGDGGSDWTCFTRPTPGQPNAAATGIAEPWRILLAPPRPNPARSGTDVLLRLPYGGAEVLLEVYDLRGRRLRRLWGGRLPGGERRFHWDRRDDAGRGVAAGTYLLRAVVDGRPELRKVVLIR